jgi:acyl-coenzyme A synthetase/AMP-(fatty) acid ligase
MQRPDLASTSRFILRHARETPDATAIVEDGSPISYRAMAEDLVRHARAIETLGVRPGMLVGVVHPRRYAHLLLLLACEAIGAATASLAPNRADGVAEYCDIVLAGDALTACRWPKAVVMPPDLPPTRDEHMTLPDRDVPPGRTARIVTTSGTTGQPKVMALSFATLQLRVTRAIERLPRDIPPRPRMLCLYAVGVAGMFVRVLSMLRLGGSVLLETGETAGALIAAGKVDLALFTAGDLERFVPEATAPPVGHSLHVLVFGAAVSALLRQQVRERLNALVDNPYAASETDPIAMLDDGGAGMLCPGVEVRIVDGEGRAVADGETGTIQVRTETMVQEYFNDPEMTAASFAGGWYLVVLGRADGMLNIGGVKVPPTPIEARLKQIGGIGDAVVMRIGDPNEVGVLVAAVETRAPDLEAMQRVGAVLSEHVGTFVIMPLRRFPRTESGKVKRREIEVAFHQRPARELIVVR